MAVTKLFKNTSLISDFKILRSMCTSSFLNQKSHYPKLSKFGYQKTNVFPSLCNQSSLKFHTSARNFNDPDEEPFEVRKLPVEDFSKPMVNLTFVKNNGEVIKIKGRVGLTVMQEAVRNNLPMSGSCEGQLSCTTCHCYIEDSKRKQSRSVNPYVGTRVQLEEDLLDNAPFVQPNSRLSCQVIITEECEKVRFRLPLATVHFNVDKKKADRN